MSLLCYWSKYLPDDGIQWHLGKPRTSSIGQYTHYRTATLQWPSKWPAKWILFFNIVLYGVALEVAQTIRSNFFIIVILPVTLTQVAAGAIRSE